MDEIKDKIVVITGRTPKAFARRGGQAELAAG